jgi:hypothetical protein
MTAHVPDDALYDLAIGEGAEALRSHAASCEPCARRLEEVRSGLELARRAEVPEPSPLYWESLRSGVRRRIAEQRRSRPAWTVLVPLAAAASLVALLVSQPGSRPRRSPPPPLAAWSALPLAEEDDSLQVLEGLALASADLADWDGGLPLPEYVAGLTDEESHALAESLRTSGQGGES